MRDLRLLLLTLAVVLLSPSLDSVARPVAVRYSEGSVQSFLVLRSGDGSVIALGDTRQHFWLYRPEPPGFLAAEGPFYPDGPIWRIEITTPTWPSDSSPRS